jgi:hypothetical protein
VGSPLTYQTKIYQRDPFIYLIPANMNNKDITNIYAKSLTTWSGVLGTIPRGSL